MSCARRARLEGLPDARCWRRRAEGKRNGNYRHGVSSKEIIALRILKEIAPRVERVAVLRDPTVAAGIGQFAAIQAAGSVGMELSAIGPRDAEEIERAIADFARHPNGGLIVTASQFGTNNPGPLVALAARHKLPSVYPFRYFASAGGLISYGSDQLDEYHRAAAYVDRILKGEKPADLPVQAPTKYQLAINLKTAKGLGLTVPPALLARADGHAFLHSAFDPKRTK